MTLTSLEQLKKWIADMASLLDQNQDPTQEQYNRFLEEPSLALHLVELISNIDEDQMDDDRAYYSSCIYALDICVAQLQIAGENGNKIANKTLSALMSCLAKAISNNQHSLSFWLPILNAFYEVHVELSEELKFAYLELATENNEMTVEEEASHLNSIRDLIEELSDLSVFDIAENFFAQSYAMPADFFSDLLMDLYSIPEGQDIAILILMHPKQDVREMAVATYEQMINHITLTPISLSRLQVIKNWYPSAYHEQFNRWIKQQRKKGVVFNNEVSVPTLRIEASEVDGSGAQGVFIQVKKARKNRLCGLLFKQQIGIKDAWITPFILAKDIIRYQNEAFGDGIMLRKVDLSYLLMLTNHFLAVTLEQGNMPELHLLEIQEELGVHFVPRKLDIEHLIEQLAIQISPFTPEHVQASFKRSKSWPKNKQFTESWYVENSLIDKLVNQCCSYINGVKVCRFEEAITAVFAQEMELRREHWLFHFLWITLWLKARARKNEKTWQDSFMIVHAIHTGTPLQTIPILREICLESIINSVETMEERRTHLNRQV